MTLTDQQIELAARELRDPADQNLITLALRSMPLLEYAASLHPDDLTAADIIDAILRPVTVGV